VSASSSSWGRSRTAFQDFLGGEGGRRLGGVVDDRLGGCELGLDAARAFGDQGGIEAGFESGEVPFELPAGHGDRVAGSRSSSCRRWRPKTWRPT
jgi:hypothetical protein